MCELFYIIILYNFIYARLYARYVHSLFSRSITFNYDDIRSVFLNYSDYSFEP